jgi:lipoprotein-releasing system permease protein
MRNFVWLAVIAVVGCTKTSNPDPPQKRDPWDVKTGSGSGSGSAGSADIPDWAHDPPDVLRDKINGVNAHVIVLKTQTTFAEYRDVLKTVEATPGVVTAEPFIFVETEISTPSHAAIPCAIKAVDPSRVGRVLTVGRHMKSGTLDSLAKGSPPSLVLGDTLATKLGVKIGDDVTIKPLENTHLGSPARAPVMFRVSGTFHMSFDEYDGRLGFASLPAVQAMLDRGDQVMGIEMTVENLDKSGELAKELEKTLGGAPYRVMDWYELNKQLFTAMYGDRRP